MLLFRVRCARQNFYVVSLYRNPDPDDKIYDCLLTSMAAVKAEDLSALIMFVSDLNDHHQEWFGSTTTNRHGVTALNFATVSGCNQLVIGSTHAHGGTLDLPITNVPDLVQVTFLAMLGNSDHSSLSTAISMSQPVTSLCISRKELLKYRVNWTKSVLQYVSFLGEASGVLAILLKY